VCVLCCAHKNPLLAKLVFPEKKPGEKSVFVYTWCCNVESFICEITCPCTRFYANLIMQECFGRGLKAKQTEYIFSLKNYFLLNTVIDDNGGHTGEVESTARSWGRQ
jgi:hypothetical protein